MFWLLPLLCGMDNYAYFLNKILKLSSSRKDIDESRAKSQDRVGEEIDLLYC